MARAKAGKPKKKKSSSKAGPTGIARLLSEDAAGLRRGVLTALTVTAVGVGVMVAMRRLESHVHALTHFDRVQLWVEWEACPPFLQNADNIHILRSLEHEIALTASDTILDEGLAMRVATALSRPDIGWVKRIERVVVRPDGRISILCDFREPTAYIAMGSRCFLVDSEGVRLPGEYAPEECELSRMLTIRGVEALEPMVGDMWTGEDVVAGLRLVTMLERQPFRDQVASINVENFNGRISRNQPHLVLATNRPGSRIWWGRPPDQEQGIENTARQKLALLQQLYSEYGRIDINQPYIDVRTYPNSVTMPRGAHGT